MALFDKRYKITVTGKDGQRHTGYAEHHLLIGSTEFLLKKKVAQVGVSSVECLDTHTGKPPTASEIHAE
jgi:hypothetical protein